MAILSSVRHPISITGAVLTTMSALLFIIFLIAEMMGMHTNPYMGIVFFIFLPLLFIVGLLLIPLGSWRQRKRVAAGKGDAVWPTLNLNSPRHRQVTATVLMLTFVNVVIVSLAAVSGIHFMDSTEFCGTVCHEAMEPQYVAFQTGEHARVGCAQCHIGSGASSFVKAKMAGTRQLVSVSLNSFARPIPAPVHNLRAAPETCGQCHWNEKFHGDKMTTKRDYADDEANTPSETVLQMRIGGGNDGLRTPTGIHWHTSAANKVEYITTDGTRQTIPWVRVTDRSGAVREYVAEGTTPEALAAGERRTMDCVDCHNRAGHAFAASPQRAVDAAISAGEIPADMPFARRQSVAALNATYDSKDAALERIATGLRTFYRTEQPAVFASRSADVERVVTATQTLYSRNIFPTMKVGFGTYINNLGHTDFPGCFRCHDETKKTQDGRVISQSCDLCHTIR